MKYVGLCLSQYGTVFHLFDETMALERFYDAIQTEESKFTKGNNEPST